MTVTEEARRYLPNAYEPFNFDFVLLVIEKDVITTNLLNLNPPLTIIFTFIVN